MGIFNINYSSGYITCCWKRAIRNLLPVHWRLLLCSWKSEPTLTLLMEEKTAFSLRLLPGGRGRDSPTAPLLLKQWAHFDIKLKKLQETSLEVWKKKHEKAGRIPFTSGLDERCAVPGLLERYCARLIQRWRKTHYNHLSKKCLWFCFDSLTLLSLVSSI